MDRRFFHRLGASLLDRTICSSAGMFGMRYTVGASVGTNPETVDQAKYILIWGSNVITSNIHLWRYILKARSRGAKIVTIDPLRTKTGEQSDEHIAIMPGTDGALALGDDAHHRARWIAGSGLHRSIYDRIRPTEIRDCRNILRRASVEITGIPEQTIERLTHEYAGKLPRFHSRELRTATARGRRHGGAQYLLPARTGRLLALSRRRRRAEHERIFQVQLRGARTAGPDSRAIREPST